MKKKTIFFLVLILTSLALVNYPSYAAELSDININSDKTIVHPKEEVTITVDFGTELASYDFTFQYDKNLLEYVEVTGGTANDTNTGVIVSYYDTAGGSNPRSNMSIKFKGKTEITTSNPTQINFTASGMSSAGTVVTTYDPIVNPITKQLIVEPIYQDYSFSLDYTGDIVKQEEKDMKLTLKSSMGKNYAHVRILADVTKPNGATVKLIGKDENQVDKDIVQSGWGIDAGYAIGGVNVAQVLNLKGLFSEIGQYNINFKLVDRDDSDKIIIEKKFELNVVDKTISSTPTPTTVLTTTPTQEEKLVENKKTDIANETKSAITKNKIIPKAGINWYLIGFALITVLVITYMCIPKKK